MTILTSRSATGSQGPEEQPGAPTTLVVATDKFKGSVTAMEACNALAAGLAQVLPGARIITIPIGDGGDGSVSALVSTGHQPLTVDVVGPMGAGHRTDIAISPTGKQAFVELASTCGIDLLPGRILEPMRSGTRGLGLALRAALDTGVARIGIGLGGSASTDGGLGMLQALGARVLDAHGADCQPGAAGLLEVTSIDLTGLDPRIADVAWFVASDVDVPLLGHTGAARMFGPQKGLTGRELAAVEGAMRRWARLLEEATGRPSRDRPGAGAAGGVGFAASAVLGASVRSGSAYIIEAVDLPSHVETASLVVTGEGRWDAQTERGKGPGAVLGLARRSGVATAVVAGSVEPGLLESDGLLAIEQLIDLEPHTARAMRMAPVLLHLAGERIGHRLASDKTATTTAATPAVRGIR